MKDYSNTGICVIEAKGETSSGLARSLKLFALSLLLRRANGQKIVLQAINHIASISRKGR
jgi:hypothetical protein